ncbi:P-II family nitrogen regulator [Clostridium thermarum]|uniref:P-II family nitrogen regulator n=1 Tax=Clostridium thermarum TaxID=1716543 RepID=UPI0013D76065|nr:P-II family nitrogen regulator [Clostridium thermarum]
MQNTAENHEIELICVIVNFGLGSDIIKFAKQHGITGGTIFLGKGTIKNTILEFFDIAETRKEIVLMGAEAATAHTVMEELNKKFKFYKPHHGIAFSTSITGILGTKSFTSKIDNENREVKNPMYNIIMAIVDKGKAEEVIEAAQEAGSRGGTIINARGSGIHETSKLFSMEIEPEKEIVMVISEKSLTETIAKSISEKLHMSEPGNGIIFIQDVIRTYGLYDN